MRLFASLLLIFILQFQLSISSREFNNPLPLSNNPRRDLIQILTGLPSSNPTSSPSSLFTPTEAPTYVLPSSTPTSAPSAIDIVVSFDCNQILSGIKLSVYQSNRDISDAIFKATIASCISGINPSDVKIIKFLDSSLSSNQMKIFYTVTFKVQGDENKARDYYTSKSYDLKSSLLSGYFNSVIFQLGTKYSSDLKLSSSSSVIINSPTLVYLKSRPPTSAPINSKDFNNTPAFLALVISTVVCLPALVLAALLYYYYRHKLFCLGDKSENITTGTKVSKEVEFGTAIHVMPTVLPPTVSSYIAHKSILSPSKRIRSPQYDSIPSSLPQQSQIRDIGSRDINGLEEEEEVILTFDNEIFDKEVSHDEHVVSNFTDSSSSSSGFFEPQLQTNIAVDHSETTE